MERSNWTGFDIFRLAIVSLADEKPEIGVAPAAYLFGHTPDNEVSLLERGAELFNRGRVGQIWLCGGGPYRTPGRPEAPIAYNGEYVWRELLMKLGVPTECIHGLPRPELSHTGTEAERLVLCAKERGWKDVLIVAFPMHMPRAFANTITQALRLYPDLRIWCIPGITLPYDEEAIFSQGTVSGTRLFEGIESEFERIKTIWWGNSLDIAPPKQVWKYLLTRKERRT